MVALGLSLGVAVSNSFARFAYGLILPAMREDLAWSYAEAGWLNTANALGYLAGAILTFTLIGRVSLERMFVLGMLVTSLSLLFSGFTEDFERLTALRVSAGLAGAPVFISGGALVARIFPDQRRAVQAIALYFSGGGLGVLISGVALPALFASQGVTSWPVAWVVLGTLSGLSTVISALAIRYANPPNISSTTPAAVLISVGQLPVKAMVFALTGYGFFAAGSIVYMTFLAAWMQDNQAGQFLVSATWGILGIAIMISPFAWRAVLARYSNGVPLALASAGTATGTLFPLAMSTHANMIVSGAIFGLSIFMVPSAITAFVRKNLPVSLQPSGIALFTVIFAIGQSIGPVSAGALGDAVGTILSGLVFAGGVLTIGAVCSFRQRSLNQTKFGTM